ncbi:hypothetical protein K8I31_08240 [bacterium]|nr:hypothetical protein [bacterium]
MRNVVLLLIVLIFASCSGQVEVGDEILAVRIQTEIDLLKDLEYSVQYIVTTYKQRNDLITQRIQQAFERDEISNQDPDFEKLYAQQVHYFAQNAFGDARIYNLIETKDYTILSEGTLGSNPNWQAYQGLFNQKRMFYRTNVCDKSLFRKIQEFRLFEISYLNPDRRVTFQGDRIIKIDPDLKCTIFPLNTFFGRGSFKNKVGQMLKPAEFPAEIKTIIPREQALCFDINTYEKLPPRYLLCENNDERRVRQYAYLHEGEVKSDMRWSGRIKVDGADYAVPQMMIHESFSRGLPQTTIVSVYSCRFGRETDWPLSAMEFIKNDTNSSFDFGIEEDPFHIIKISREEFFQRYHAPEPNR